MTGGTDIVEQMMSNWVSWAIVILALICYQQLWEEYLAASDSDNEGIKHEFSSILIGALPLLGLLGTIIGLLDSFSTIANEGASSSVLSGGIADALFTTQLGLVCAVPGWLLQAYVRSRMPRFNESVIAR